MYAHPPRPTLPFLVRRATVPRILLLAWTAQRQARICMHEMHYSNVKRRWMGQMGHRGSDIQASPASLFVNVHRPSSSLPPLTCVYMQYL